MENKSLLLALFSIFYVLGLCAFYSGHDVNFALFVAIVTILLCLFEKLKPAFCVILYIIFFTGIFNANFQNKDFDSFSNVIRANNVKLKGRIYSIPKINNEKENIKFFMGVYSANIFEKDFIPSHTKVLVSINDANSDNLLKIGDVIEISGNLRSPKISTNPSEFNYKKYLQNKDVFNILYVNGNSFDLITKPDIKNSKNKIKELWWFLLQKMDNLREKIICKHSKYIKSPNLEVLGGIVFGDDAINPPDEIKQSFINSGLLHLLAASGLNVALIFGIWWALVSFLNFPYKFNIISGMAIILLYTFMTGFPPSILRASIMLMLVLIGKLLFKTADNLSLIFFTGFVILLFNPKLLNDVGFQLSFLVTGGLITCVEPVCSKFKSLDKKFKKRFYKKTKITKLIFYTFSPVALVGMAVVPIVSQLWAMPLQMYYFNTFSLYTIFANIAVLPFIGIISFLGFISSTVAVVPFFGNLTVKVLSFILNPFITILLNISNFFSNLSYSIIKMPSPAVLQMVIYYVLILFFIYCFKHNFKKLKANIIFGIICLIFLLTFIKIPNNNFEILAFDVQNADCFLIKTPKNKYIMIDTGRLPYKGVSSARKVILEYLYDNNIKNIENLIVTHLDSDHSGGTIDLLQNIKVKNLIMNNLECDTENSCKIIDFIKKNKIKIRSVQNNETIYSEDNFEIKALIAGIKSQTKHENENSIIILVNNNEKYALFMADAGKDAFKKIKDFIPKDIEVLKVGHHGAKNTVDKEMLEYLKPKYSLISTGYNIYGHPDVSTLKMLENSGTKIFSTKDLGAIKVVFNELQGDVEVYGYITPEKQSFNKIKF